MVNKLTRFMRYEVIKAIKDIKKALLDETNWVMLSLIVSLIFYRYGNVLYGLVLLLIAFWIMVITKIKSGFTGFEINLKQPPIWKIMVWFALFFMSVFLVHKKNMLSLMSMIMAIIFYLIYEWTKGHWKWQNAE